MLLPSTDSHWYDRDQDTLPCVGEAVRIPGPAGTLEAITACPPVGAPMRAVGVVCHPHPLYGGSLKNKVVHYVSQALNELGVGTVRFNFRGVGASEGDYDGGQGETDDLLAVLDWARKQRPEHAVWLAGFSFGSYVVLRAAARRSVSQVITVAPPVNFFEFAAVSRPACSWLLVQGDRDEVVPCSQVLDWAGRLDPPPTTICMADVGHFFHGRLNELRARLLEALGDGG
ncbi:MAG: alpha/beta fold hydrolase [Gammaproteobacteria bacterium]